MGYGRRAFQRSFWMMVAFMVIGFLGISGCGGSGPSSHEWSPFSFMTDSDYNYLERFFLILNVFIAFGGLYYAYTLIKEVYGAETGTPRMQEIARAVREGALAYLKRQFTTVAVMIFVLTFVLIFTANPHTEAGWKIPIGRGIAFLMGSLFSATVGFVGMYLATDGNLRVAAAAKHSFGKALQIGYRTGTITGMLTDGLGLLGGSLIFLYFGEKAYEALLGFGFGGTLLALFMRVGGGIYTKAADVGADLVGKIEANIPEDDPRNAATIADNVGDNVGDCAGMAADIFESYEVTIVAAMILGYASFGHKGVTMRAVNKGFWLGSVISVIGFMALGVIYLWFTDWYIVNQAVGRGLYREAAFQEALGLEPKDIDALEKTIAEARLENTSQAEQRADQAQKDIDHYREEAVKSWKSLSGDEQTRLAKNESLGLAALAKKKYVPLWQPLDMRPALTCFVGILLAIALNFCTEYWTGTEYEPVKSLAKSCRTGHATNIIQGIAVGYESTVWAVLIIAVAILSSAVIYAGTNPIFVAFGVAMCGIGMLTLTGNTISMDVFGPVADNANGIGEMGYNKDTNNQDLKPGVDGYMSPEDYKRARQILADLDAVGNTTKAITKGIAIGSAVIAAVSLFASFIAVMATGSEEGINRLSTSEFIAGAAKLSLADPRVFIGMLIGGAVPFLFSSMTIRAVGRAAYLIVQECRVQFRDKEIWAGTKKPNYGRVVDICTGTAQKELIGPALLAIFTPVFVGFFLGPFALGGFLGGMIVVGQLLAAYMANAGGAWDNAKKTIEDQPRTKLTGKGSEVHKASVTGDTVGDPLKDTAGPAINPLIKVMNMVSLLVLPLVISYNISDGKSSRAVGFLVMIVAAAAVGWAWWQSKRESKEMQAMDEEFSRAAAAEMAGAGEAGAATAHG